MNRVLEEHGQETEDAATVFPCGSLTIFQLAEPSQAAVTEADTVLPTRTAPLGRDHETRHPLSSVDVVVVVETLVLVEVLSVVVVESVVEVVDVVDCDDVVEVVL